MCFYARYTYWAGDFAWGDRYVSTAVEMVALCSAFRFCCDIARIRPMDLARQQSS